MLRGVDNLLKRGGRKQAAKGCRRDAYFARTELRRLAGREPYNSEAARRQSPGLGTVDAAERRHAVATRAGFFRDGEGLKNLQSAKRSHL